MKNMHNNKFWPQSISHFCVNFHLVKEATYTFALKRLKYDSKEYHSNSFNFRVQKEKEEFKSIKTVYDNEYEALKYKYNEAMGNIGRLKKEILEKEKLLDTEKKSHVETKRKIKDTISGQTELECKINALEMQLEEQRNQLVANEEEIYKVTHCKNKRTSTL